MIENSRNKIPRFRVFAALSLAGLIFCILFVIYLKKNYIFKEEYELARKLSIIFFIAFVIAPFAFYSLFLLDDKVLSPFLHRIFDRRRQRRIEKYGCKIVSREERNSSRINKVLAPYFIVPTLSIPLCIFISAFLALGIRRLQKPEGDLNEDTVTIILMISITIVSMTITGFLICYTHVRVFMKKKGVRKALKYAVGLKKQPGLIAKYWLHICGINDIDIQSYLSKMPRK
ncbi:MAG: hypothetical protein ACYTER_04085 [Planctomycetota bacterium]